MIFESSHATDCDKNLYILFSLTSTQLHTKKSFKLRRKHTGMLILGGFFFFKFLFVKLKY